MRALDLLDVLALEHRELLDACDELRSGAATPDAVRRLIRQAAVHEAAERFLVHPLMSATEHPAEAAARRSDRQLLGSRLSVALAFADQDTPHRQCALEELRESLVGCTDADEILTYPQVRHVVPVARLRELVARHRALVAHLAEAPIAEPGTTAPLQVADRHTRAYLGRGAIEEPSRTIVVPDPLTT